MTHRAYRSISIGLERLATHDLPRHYHREAYATVVLSGRFRENAFSGESQARPGDVLLHGAWDAHCNASAGAASLEILRLPWEACGLEGHFCIENPDEIVRLAERDLPQALATLKSSLLPASPNDRHWSVRLAEDLQQDRALCLSRWADENNLSPEAVSRGFHRHFGAAPRLFRLEAHTRAAWRAIVLRTSPLTAIAHDCGFADLAHMSRSVQRMTGAPPASWRQHQVRSSQGRVREVSQRYFV